MRVFVTGASGYIGTAVCAAMKKRGHDVVGLARSDATIAKLLAAGVHPVRGGMADLGVLREMAHDADAIVHLAQQQSAEHPALESAALDAMFAAIDTDHEAFLYTSGCWVYGNTQGVADESAPLDPVPLVAWRPAHEQRVLAHGRGGRPIVIRPGIVYGHGGGIVAMMTGQASSGTLNVVGDGSNDWNFVHVEDVASLYVAALEQGKTGIYNCGTANLRVGEVAEALAKKTGAKIANVTVEQARQAMGPFADALAVDQRISSEKANRDLAWSPSGPSVFEEIAKA